MDELIYTIKNDENVKKDIAHEIVKYREINYLTKTKIGNVLLHKAKTFEEALKVLGEEIYELDTENQVLSEQIGDKIDNEYVKEQIALQNFKDTDDGKYSKILNRLTKRYKTMKAIK
jgi:hypothetical protein